MYILKFFGDILSKDLFLGMLFRGCVWDQLTHFYLAFHWLSKSQPPNCCLLTKAGTHLQGRLINIFTSLSLSGFCLRWRMEVTNELFILLGEEGKWGVWWLSCDLASSLSSWTLVTVCTMPGPWRWLWTWLLHFGKSIWGLMVHLTGGKEGHPLSLPWVAGGRKVSVKLEVGAPWGLDSHGGRVTIVSSERNFTLLKIYFYYFKLGICLHGGMNPSPGRGYQIPWHWSYKCLWTVQCGCGDSIFRSLARAVLSWRTLRVNRLWTPILFIVFPMDRDNACPWRSLWQLLITFRDTLTHDMTSAVDLTAPMWVQMVWAS